MIVIRTQDGCKIQMCGDIRVYGKVISAHTESKQLFSTLGCYETEERALEVLDEMHKHINMVRIAAFNSHGARTADDFNYIFEMPKE